VADFDPTGGFVGCQGRPDSGILKRNPLESSASLLPEHSTLLQSKREVSSTAPVQQITLKREEAYVSQDSSSSDSKRICGFNRLDGGNIRAITC
jgi:hypothetical protein